MDSQIKRLAFLARQQPFFMAYAVDSFQKFRKWNDRQLADYLEFDPEQIHRLCLCANLSTSDPKYLEHLKSVSAFVACNADKLHKMLATTAAIPLRLQELGTLRDGWLEGKGVAPPSAGLAWFTEYLGAYPDDLPFPCIFPTESGGLLIEWTIGNVEASLEVDLNTHEAFWHAWHTDTDKSTEITFDLDDGWQWAAEMRSIMVPN